MTANTLSWKANVPGFRHSTSALSRADCSIEQGRRSGNWHEPISGRTSSDAYESTPYRRKTGAHQNVDRIVAESTTVSAHLNAQSADLMMAGSEEQPRQDDQNTGDEVHRTPSRLCDG
jgi:hypothetical protein